MVPLCAIEMYAQRVRLLERKDEMKTRSVRHTRRDFSPARVALFLASLALLLCDPATALSANNTEQFEHTPYGFVQGDTTDVFKTPFYGQMTDLRTAVNDDFAPSSLISGNIGFLTAGLKSAAISVDGSKLVTWGTCAFTGQGKSGTGLCASNVPVDFGDQKIIGMASGNFTSLLLLENGTMFSWGGYDEGNFRGCEKLSSTEQQLGLTRISVRVSVYRPEVRITKLAAYYESALALDSSGVVWAFGHNTYYGLGTFGEYPTVPINQIHQPTPTELQPWGSKLLPVVDISAGRINLLLLDDGSYYCFGMSRVACNGQSGKYADSYPQFRPTRVVHQIRWKRLFSIYETVFAWDEDGSPWAWGGGRFLPFNETSRNPPPIDKRFSSPKQVASIPGFGQIVDLFRVSDLHLYAITESNHVFNFSRLSSLTFTWNQVNFPLQDHHFPDISRASASGRAFIGTTIKMNRERVCNPPTAPSEPPGEKVCTADGSWSLVNSATTNASHPIILNGTINIRGNLTVAPSTTITVAHTSSLAFSVESCLFIEGLSSVTVDLANEEHVTKTKQIGLFEYDTSDCHSPNIDNLQLNLIRPKSAPECRRFKTSKAVSNEKETRGRLSMLVEIDNSACRLWWIILVSVVGGVIVITAILTTIGLVLLKKRRKSKGSKLDNAVE